ncbi:RDD family protein [Glycomyces xiaoerkulensis]|uniref:RDD family protein n=1 Tax=Glycomyces xiaoerkulensis TaxID=2038139 RepID=UPI0012FFFF88|nr:RDD family protein [Glycomyces xiaoerkulensis]
MTQTPPGHGPQVPDHYPAQPTGSWNAPPPAAARQAPPKAGRRIAGRAVDLAVWALAMFLIGTWAVQSVTERAVDVLPREVVGAAVGVLTSGGDVESASGDIGEAAWDLVVSRFRLAILLMIGFHLAYEAAANLWKGRTLGRLALGMRIIGRSRPGIGFGRALARAAVTVGCTGALYGLAWIALLHGNLLAGFGLWLLSVAALITYVVVPMLGAERRSPADMAAGTRVVRAGARAGTGPAAASAVGAARQGTAQAAQRVPVQRLAESEPVRRARETGGRWAGQAAESEQARRLRELGSSAKGRVTDAYRNRRGDRPPPPPGPQ